MPTEDLRLRPAVAEDGERVAEIHLAARRAAVPLMPALVHRDDDVAEHVAATLVADGLETWVAEGDGGVVGYATLTPTWLEALYVDPAHQGAGAGSALLDLAIALRPDGFGLWVFASNTPARRFYLRHGLHEHETTDGSDNEERCPDVRMSWPGGTGPTATRRVT